jgi:hypothetical protein
MTAPTTTVFQANFKVGNDLHNVYADTASDFLEQLDFFAESALPKIVAITQQIQAAFTVAATIPVAPAVQQSAPPPATAVPVGATDTTQAAHLCEHGQPMRLVPAGISKSSGKPYKAFYACAQPRGMQCNTKITL